MAFPSSLTICDLYTCKADEITARVKAEMQDLEHPGLPAPEPGTRLVHNGENHVVTSISPDGVVIMREDEEGNYSLPEVISTDTYYAEKQAEIDAQEQEQQPQSGERGEAAQETASPAEEEPAPVTGGGAVQEETAPGRMPKDEQGQPLYEQADAETAWDALLEQAGGDEAMAQEVANDIVSEQEKALKAAERELKKVQDGKPQQRKGDAPLTVEARIAAKQAVREQTSRAQAGVDEARKRLEAWMKIAETPQRRRQAIEAERRQEEEEAARLRGIQEEQERAERDEAERIRREALNGVPDFIEDRPQDARAGGYRRVNGNRVDRQQPIQARRGGEVQVKFDDNNIPTGHAALIEASQLQPSHTDGRRNPQHFIDEAQPKERNDEASVMSSRKIAANIRPEEITSSVTAYTGAPTVNSRGEVIQGNNRSAALREMWAEHPEQAAKYRQYLADHAADFGLTPEDVEAMQQPVLVNMLDVTDDEAITLGQFVAQDTESGGTERIKPKNMVRKMGDDMRSFANRLLASADEEMSFAELVDRNGVDVLKWMQQKGYITPTQYKSAFDSKGNLTAEAKNDLKGVMYQSIFQNGSTHLEEMFNALPAKAQKAILATAYRDYDSPNPERMIEEIQDSISAYYALSQDAAFAGARNYKEARIAAEAWKRQYAFDDATGESYLPSERYSNFALLLATMYKGQTQTFIQNTLGHIYDLVQGTQEADLFNQPDNTPRTLVQAINETLGNLREELLLNENFTYNGQRRSNVLAGGSASGQRGRQGSDGNAPSGGRAEDGARTDDGSGRTGISDNERGRQGNITDIAGRQPDGLGTSEGEVRLSDEIDENGRQFVLTSNGQLSFGEITEESGLTPAPILLSEGIITNPATNDGYGLVHIEARHGDQIRKAGYKSVIEFIEDVAQNYERIKEGNIRNGNPTYLIQLKDKHNNTLIVELSSDGNYWNINTAGIFKESYGKNRREIYNRHTTVQQSAETVGASQEAEQSGTTTSSSMNAPTSNIVSENEEDGITSSEPNGKPTVSESKDKKTSAETSQERQKTDSNLSEAFKHQMNIRIGQLSKFIKTKDGKLKKKYESLRKTPFFAIFDSGNIYEGPVAIAKTPREALNVAFNYDIGDFEVLYVDFRTKSLDMDLLSIYDVSGFRGDVYDENGAYKDEAKNLLVERISRLGKGNSTEVQGVEDFQQRESGADALRGNADENIRRAESEVERNPSEAQKEAGNYRKGHVRVDGLDVTIENPKGSVRSGTDADGKRWENVMNNTYGYMRGTEGVDGDHIDVFLSDNPESGNVYVVDQRDPKTGEFDEHKVMYGFGSMEEARDAYLKNYEPGWQGLGTITEVSKDEFRKWVDSSHRKTKPFAEYKSVKKEAGQNEDVRQSRDGSNPLSAEEAAIRDAIVERLRESGIEVITDVEAGQKVLDEANGRGEPVRTQAMLDGLKKASDFILSALGGKTKQRKARIEIPERANRLAEEAIGHPIKSHAININELVHIKKRHGENGTANDANSIPLRDEDIALMPYIMAAPTRVIKGSMAVNGTESVRYEKDLDNGVVVVVEREGRFDVEDMENITMWAKKKPATNVTVAEKASHSTSETIVISETDSAKIRKDAEDAIHGDEKVREHRVYHGSGADFEAFDHSHMGEGEGAQATTGGRKDGARNYVIFDEKDLRITDHVRFFRTPGGEAYGFTAGGKIYIDPRVATADTPIHEYAHLWAGALRQANPKEWNNIVELMRDTPAWDEVKRLYPELESDEEIADEALAMYSGRRGAERLREAARRAWDGSADLGAKAAAARAMGRVRDALRRFWQNVADLLHFRHISAEEVADRVMRDLMEGVNPNRIKSATDNTGAFSAGNDDIRYSRAEEDKSLVAVHNTSEENLKKALELGGFPMPSIAVTKADVGHTEFGEISLVFGRESIDPTDRRNKVYGEDAWTPTFPQTGYKLDEKKTNDIYRRANKAGSLPLFNPVTFHPDNYESYISGLDSKSLVEHFKDDYGAKQLYLYENGNAVDEWERHEVEKYLPDQVALSTKLLEEIGLERLKGEKDETLEYEVKRIVNDHYGIDLDGMPPFRAKIRIGNAISRAVDYAENGNRKTEADAEATKRKIDARTDQKDFEKWLEDLFDGIVEKRGIRNDKDPFTASGNRRKWEQLYDEITLDNVVEAMRRQAARGGQGLFGGSIFGAAQEEYKDIDSIRKAAKRRIRMMSHEEAETGRKTITDRLSAIEIPGVGERFSDVMDMVQNIQDAVARSHTAKGIYKYLKAFYPKVTMETANEIADIVKDIQAMSARYFEAKPYRAVGFDEVRLAVVPSDTDAGLVEQLKRKGIPVREYERGNEAERRAIVEEATDEMELRFRETEEEDANRRFNEELDKWESGGMSANEYVTVGNPIGVLRHFTPDLPIILRQKVLSKSRKKHGLSASDMRNLPTALAEPIFIFKSSDNTIGVLTGLVSDSGENIFVAIELDANKQMGHQMLEVNDILTIHGRETENIINPIKENNTLKWVDKEKGLNWLSSAKSNSQAVTNKALDTATNIVKDFENPALEDENLFRIGETKRIGGESLFGRRITFTRANPTVTLNAMKRWVLKNADLKEYDVARTGSRYLSFTHNSVDYKIRSANHTKAYDGVRPDSSGLSVSVEDRIYGVEIDLAENEMVKEDILRIIEDTDRLNDTGLNLQNTVESGLLPDEMVSADRELTDAVIREVREMAEWRLDSARTKAESEYEREHPLEDYKADNGIMILNRYFYGRVSYEVKFPDGWRGKTKQPRADAIQEYEDSDAHRRNMEQASGMNVYVDGRTKAQAETLRKIDGLANRLEQERMAGAVREMAERLHLEGVEVVTDASTLTGRRARAKGFYSPRTGKISIVIPNHASEADAVQTLLHEAVAHKGLRQLFGEHFDTFLWNVYRNADRDVRERINALASEKGWDFPTATEEYLASLAENTDFENAQRSGWWEKIKRLFIDMLHKMGLDGFSGVTLSDNELRYILWRSYENLREPGAERSITGVAADVVKQAELKVGNYAEEATGGNMAAERGKKEASETDSVLEREHQHTVISDATGTKILNNLDNLVKRYENSAQSEIKTFIGEVSKAIGARRHGSKSEYATFETKNGKIITIRLSDHNASTRNFDNAGRNNGISIVITARKNNGVANDGNAHVVEFYYDAIKLRKTAGKPLAQIVRSIQQSLYSGEYHDTTGLAVRDEVNNDEDSLLFRDGSAAEDGTRDTPLSSPTIHAWDRLAQSLKFQLRETAVDYLTAIDKFQDLIAKHSGRKIESFENAYDWMTFLSSRNRVEMDMFDSSVVRPLNNAILKLIKNGGTKQPIIFPCVF